MANPVPTGETNLKRLIQLMPLNESVMAFRDKHISHIGTCDTKCETLSSVTPCGDAGLLMVTLLEGVGTDHPAGPERRRL